MEETSLDHGLQPLDGFMDRWKITNLESVKYSGEQLNHKRVQQARKGRRLTSHRMQKLMRALNAAPAAKLTKEHAALCSPYLHKNLCSYI